LLIKLRAVPVDGAVDAVVAAEVIAHRAISGMIHYAAARALQIQREPDTFWLSRLRKGPGMQYVIAFLGSFSNRSIDGNC
jgi:hypothetical protein